MSQCVSMRVRTEAKEVLYRYRYQDLKDWVLIYIDCMSDFKLNYEDTYQYSRTWKIKKK